ncbi:helix-turn-helix domain-containing protein [Komagataeibacter oboediens]|uniref:helix-turn-helix domain-containing protein n=1 Tax=Komagataeibacter oboediens TaxID=65958 RepID=UPI00190685A8|nr:helix-turn-helix domain-containing protein [Komagataeibacter oboediens]
MTTSIASRLSSLRHALAEKLGRKVSAQEVADAVGISRSTLSGYERGHDRPGRESLLALATYYSVSVDYLASGEMPAVEHPDNVAQNSEEALLLTLWRRMDEDQRRSWLGLLRGMIHIDAA